ncbi:MAG TPA: hypothetical protein P5572_04830 [Phycisphaerae bacterium]|nr:hypothetical protein [Phycisphaerales bacterium]HRX84325.1 hypothetical protein [Phycisphaerae bacterium]
MHRTAFTWWALVGGAGLLVGIASCTDPTAPSPSQNNSVQPYNHDLTFMRHVDQPISEGTVDNILAEAGGLLASVDTDCPDVYCPATFTRTGGIGVFSEGSTVLTSEQQLDTVFNVNGDFKIVTFMVGVCGAPSGSDPAVVLGCAATAASVVIVYDAPTDVWAHEWGHVQGLPHRNDCDRNLMHAYELQTNAVNTTERDAFLSRTPGSAFINLRLSDESPCDECVDNLQEAPLTERVQRLIAPRYLQGIPADTLADVPADERTDALLAAWAQGIPAVQRANLTRLLGYTQDPRAVAAVAGWLAARSGEISTDELAAQSECLLALGRLAAVDTDGTAVAALIAGTASDTWTQRDLALPDADGSVHSAGAALARISVLALGISGVPEARAHLVALQAAARTQRPADAWFGPQVDEALARFDGDLARLRPAGRLPRQP